MTEKQSRIAILFADISGSTGLYERLGDVEAKQQVADCLGAIIDQVEIHKGQVINTIGDEVLCTFEDSETAAEAAMDMQEALDVTVHQKPDKRIGMAIRIGFHYGSVIHDDGDIFGDAVNLASRVAGLAKAGQIITTKSTLERLPATMRASTRFVDNAPVKGKRAEVSIFEIIWQTESVTRVSTGMMTVPASAQRLRLFYHDTELMLGAERPSVSLGRLPSCGLIVDNDRVSRMHARIEQRRGQFFIVDESTNGTYVELNEDEEVMFLRREEMAIKGRGSISLGARSEKSPDDVIYFSFTE